MQQKCDLLMVLSSLTMRENLELAKKNKGIDLILSTSQQHGNIVKILDQQRHTPLLAQVASEGSMLGQMTIYWSRQAGAGWLELASDNIEELQQKIDHNRQRLALFEKKVAQAKGNAQQFVAKINREKRIIHRYQSRLEFITATKERIAQKEINGFTAVFRKIYPKPGSEEIIRLISEINQQIKEASSQ